MHSAEEKRILRVCFYYDKRYGRTADYAELQRRGVGGADLRGNYKELCEENFAQHA